MPVFEVIAEDNPSMPYTNTTSTGVWTQIMRQAASIRNKGPAGSASGPDFFGLGHGTIQQLIEKLPNAEKCTSYEPKRYEMSAGKAAVALNAPASASGPGSSQFAMHHAPETSELDIAYD